MFSILLLSGCNIFFKRKLWKQKILKLLYLKANKSVGFGMTPESCGIFQWSMVLTDCVLRIDFASNVVTGTPNSLPNLSENSFVFSSDSDNVIIPFTLSRVFWRP